MLFDIVHPAFPLLTTVSPTLQGALRNDLERLLWRMTCMNHASFCLLTVARRGSCGSTRKLTLFCTQSLVFCSKRSFLRYFVSKAWLIFSESANRLHVSQLLEEGGGYKRLVQLELACKGDGVASPDAV